MADNRTDKSELTSLNQLIQEIIGGSMRRHTFTQWELELLLDLQLCGVRKSARPELLRRYVKAVHAHYSQGALGPLRLSAFLDRETGKIRPGQTLPIETLRDEAVSANRLAASRVDHARS